jgi:hypothetical protein
LVTSVSEANIAGAGADDASIGTFTWSNPGNITAKDGSYALVAGGASHFLKATSFGFSIPSGATIKGISVAVTRRSTNLDVVDEAIRLVKAGTVQTTDRAVGTAWPTTFTDQVYGGPTDLWGGTWAYTDINNSGFGAAVAANVTPPDGAEVDAITITVYYTLASGFTVTEDAVVYANQNVHLRHDGMWREAPSGTVYGRCPT